MKMIIALIQPHRLESVKRALKEKEVTRLTVIDAAGYGRQGGNIEYFRGREISVDMVGKVELQIAVNEDFLEPTIEAIIQGAKGEEGGQIGDGKIFVMPLEETIRISDNSRGSGAI